LLIFTISHSNSVNKKLTLFAHKDMLSFVLDLCTIRIHCRRCTTS